MDGSQFDRLARAFGASHTRRGVTALLAAAGALPLLGHGDGDAKKKKKKKKCKAPKVKCGKQCLPAGSCCTDVDCGADGTCQGNSCACFTGFRRCNGSCIPKDNCCGNGDCGGGVCSGGTCRCLEGTKPCGGKCIPENACCVDEDCGSPCKTCQNGTCSAGCAASETCLPNGSCGSTCSIRGSCNQAGTCSCNNNSSGFEAVCRVLNDGTVCGPAKVCTTTAECPAGTVCSSSCNNQTGDSRCLPLCTNL
jgi:hypothetical protein